MKQTEAMKYVRSLLFGMQRSRSALRETLSGMGDYPDSLVESTLEDLNPWLYGKRGEGLLKALVQVDERGSVTGMEFYNFMTIIHLLDPLSAASAGILTDTTYPQPNIHWCAGLEE